MDSFSECGIINAIQSSDLAYLSRISPLCRVYQKTVIELCCEWQRFDVVAMYLTHYPQCLHGIALTPIISEAIAHLFTLYTMLGPKKIYTPTTLVECRKMLDRGLIDPSQIDERLYLSYRSEFARYLSLSYVKRAWKARVHPIYNYEISTNPRIVCISDTHGDHEKVASKLPYAPILIFAGDACANGNTVQAQYFLKWFAAQPHPIKILVGGNHDEYFEDSIVQERMTTFGITFLNGSSVTVDDVHFPLVDISKYPLVAGLKIYGHPAVPYRPRHTWNAFSCSRRDMSRLVSIPDDTNVVVTHFPPWGIGDANTPITSAASDDSGDVFLRYRMETLVPLGALQYHIFGHVHDGVGRYSLSACDTIFVNTSGTVTCLL